MYEVAFVFAAHISTHILAKRMTVRVSLTHVPFSYFNSHPREEDDVTEELLKDMEGYFNSHPREEDDCSLTQEQEHECYFNSHPREEDDQAAPGVTLAGFISTHILAKRMTAILNKIFSFKIKLYIHYNILFAIFYIYNSILYPFSSQKCSYSGANDSANYCSLAFRTPRFPIPSLHIHFP